MHVGDAETLDWYRLSTAFVSRRRVDLDWFSTVATVWN